MAGGVKDLLAFTLAFVGKLIQLDQHAAGGFGVDKGIPAAVETADCGFVD